MIFIPSGAVLNRIFLDICERNPRQTEFSKEFIASQNRYGLSQVLKWHN